eukprot:c8966_g2_i3.p1 GENE.c8966_g2_i3~~c8966_g2_i3.p1  ORF type:complete len:438 (+),score=81.03 c8966_g2_i3:621-1934(+)
MSDGSEACKYDRICFHSEKNTFMFHNVPKIEQDFYMGFGIDFRFYEPTRGAFREIQDQTHPVGIAGSAKSLADKEWEALWNDPNVEHVSGGHIVVLQPSLVSNGNNMFHFSASVAMLIDPQYHNNTYGGWYPPFNKVLMVSGEGNLNKWTKGFMDLLVPAPAELQLVKPSSPTYCVEGAVLYGYRHSVFLSPEDAHIFRERAYKILELDIKPKHQTEPLSFPLRVLFMNRRDRSIDDPEGIQKLLESEEILKYRDGELIPIYKRYKESTQQAIPSIFSFTYEPEIEKLSFKEQLQLWASADLILTPHGAGLTAVIFARPHVPLIEIYPHKYYSLLYRDIAVMSGHGYFGIMAEALPVERYGSPDEADWCELWHGIDELTEAHCHHQYFKSSILVIDHHHLIKTVQLAIETLPFDTVPGSHSYNNPIAPDFLKPFIPA